MNEQSFEQARSYARGRLERELSPDLLYHRAGHTSDEVVPAVEKLAEMEGIEGDALILLCTAAWFHDLGYIYQAANHEAISARMAAEALPGFGYSQAEIQIVQQIVLATVLPQSPKNRLEEIMADADLYTLGGENFTTRHQDLRGELARAGKQYSDHEWTLNQMEFLESHQYFTASARAARDEQKRLNHAGLQARLANLGGGE